MATDVVTYAALDKSTDFLEVLKENLGGEQLTPQDLPRVSMAAGGRSSWEIPSLDGPKAAQELRGIVIHDHNARRYWPGKLATDAPPTCASDDGIVGVGEPGGPCVECPLSQFGSGEDGRGQACKMMRVIYLLTTEQVLPLVVQLPPTSLQAWRQYVLGLTTAGIGKGRLETVLTLESAKNASGVAYSRVVVRPGRRLEALEQEAVREYAHGFVASL